MATVGKKVDARFVKNRYQEFLVGKTKSKSNESTEPRPQAKPNAALPYPMIKLQKREEMRRKGIFVEADNTENDNTFMEQISKSRPCVCHMRTRKLKWKKKKRGDEGSSDTVAVRSKRRRKASREDQSSSKRKNKEEEMQKSEKSESKMKKRSSDTTIDAGSKESTTKFGSGEAAGVAKCCGSSEGTGIIRCVESVESNPSIKCADPAKLAAGESARAPKVVEGADTYEQNDSKDSKELAAILSDRKSRKDVLLGTAEPLLPEDNTQPDDVEESAGGAQQVSEAPPANETPSKGEQAATETKSEDKKEKPSETVESTTESKTAQPTESGVENKAAEPTEAPSESSQRGNVEGQSDATTQPASSQLEPKSIRTSRDDVFGEIDEEADLTKVLADFDAGNVEGVGASDKKALDAAKKILRLAYKEKAIEKALTKEENNLISKFFAGKLPYDQNVIELMDRVLDKTIDYMQSHGTQFDEETQRLINKRAQLKAAMLETMLTTPKFIPKTWVKEYDRLHKEALKKTQGINWAKILLFYPKQRSFEDGEADIYGNFTRAHRSYWIVGCILGPTDSKSFEETEKEKNLNCLFLETDVMEEAKKVKGSKRPRQKRENRQPGAADEPNSGRSVLTEEISKLQEPPSTPEQPSSLISDSSATTETPSVTGK